MVSPTCNIGPGELCTSLEGVIVACDEGDAASCLAVAQYLQDTPPRPTQGVLVFLLAAAMAEDIRAAAAMRADRAFRPKPGFNPGKGGGFVVKVLG